MCIARKIMTIKYIICLLAVVFATEGLAQGVSKQYFQCWPDASLKLNLKKGWQFSTQYRVRFTDNITNYKGSYLFLTIEKKLNKHIDVFTNYRLAIVEGNGYHRYLLGTNFQYKISNFTAYARPMIQYQSQFFANDEGNPLNTKTFIRLRTGLKYELAKHWDLNIYAEPFLKWKKSQALETQLWQNYLGITHQYMKNATATLYYSWQPEVNKKYPNTNQVFGLSLGFQIKTHKKHKHNGQTSDPNK